MAVDIIFETHSTSEDNEHGIATGWLPGALSAAGREQARALGVRRRDSGVDADSLDDLARDRDERQVLLIGHAATRFALQHVLERRRLEDVVGAPFAWQTGWHYQLGGDNG